MNKPPTKETSSYWGTLFLKYDSSRKYKHFLYYHFIKYNK